jgi:alpha-tubulin suppressor-like RCC1 family protein
VPPFGRETSLGEAAVDLAAGVSHTCALLASGAVRCFGLNNLGQVGPSPGTPDEEVRAPAPVSGFSGRVVALGAGSSAQHTCAILADGSVACWGHNHAGQLGDAPAALERGRFSATPVTVRW